MRAIAPFCILTCIATAAIAQSSGGGGTSGGGTAGAPGGSTAGRGAATPGMTAPVSPNAPQVPGRTPGVAPPPGVGGNPAPGSNVDARPPTERLPAGPQGTPTATPAPGTQEAMPVSGGRTDPGASSSSTAHSGKNAFEEGVRDCLRLWDKGTHMSPQQWRTTCPRRGSGKARQSARGYWRTALSSTFYPIT